MSAPYEEAYERTAAELQRQLGDVTSPESAQSFVEEAVRQVREAAVCNS